jgi:hypothetical protein
VSEKKEKNSEPLFLEMPKNYMRNAVTVSRDSRSLKSPSFSFLLWNGRKFSKKLVTNFLSKVYKKSVGKMLAPKVLGMEVEPWTIGDCWVWKGGKRKGYGIFWTGLGNISAHYFANLIFRGPLNDESKELNHNCRRRNCVNPGHLEAVDHQFNCELREIDKRGIPAEIR